MGKGEMVICIEGTMDELEKGEPFCIAASSKGARKLSRWRVAGIGIYYKVCPQKYMANLQDRELIAYSGHAVSRGLRVPPLGVWIPYLCAAFANHAPSSRHPF